MLIVPYCQYDLKKSFVIVRVSAKDSQDLTNFWRASDDISPLNWDIVQKTLPKNNFQEDLRRNQLDGVYSTQELYQNQFRC